MFTYLTWFEVGIGATFDIKKTKIMSKVTRHLLQLAKVLHGKKHDFVKVKTVHMVFNDRFRFHFNEPEEFWVLNKGNTAQQGDIVLLKELPETYAIDIKHTVHKVRKLRACSGERILCCDLYKSMLIFFSG